MAQTVLASDLAFEPEVNRVGGLIRQMTHAVRSLNRRREHRMQKKKVQEGIERIVEALESVGPVQIPGFPVPEDLSGYEALHHIDTSLVVIDTLLDTMPRAMEDFERVLADRRFRVNVSELRSQRLRIFGDLYKERRELRRKHREMSIPAEAPILNERLKQSALAVSRSLTRVIIEPRKDEEPSLDDILAEIEAARRESG